METQHTPLTRPCSPGGHKCLLDSAALWSDAQLALWEAERFLVHVTTTNSPF